MPDLPISREALSEIEKLLTIKFGSMMIGKPYPTVGELVDAAKPLIDSYAASLVEEARITDNHDWDTETFKPIKVCRRCATTFQTRGNKPCKGKMAKIALRSQQADRASTLLGRLSEEETNREDI